MRDLGPAYLDNPREISVTICNAKVLRAFPFLGSLTTMDARQGEQFHHLRFGVTFAESQG